MNTQTRSERLVLKTEWGHSLDLDLVRNIGKFIDSLLDEKRQIVPSQNPTVMSEDQVRKLNKRISMMEFGDVNSIPFLSAMCWEPVNDFEGYLTPLGIMNGVLQSMLGKNCKLVIKVAEDGTATSLILENTACP